MNGRWSALRDGSPGWPAAALSEVEVAERLTPPGGRADPELARRVHEATAGWPALVGLAARQLAGGTPPADRLLDELARPGTPVAAYLAQEVVAPLPAAARRALDDAAHLDHVCADLFGRRSAALDHLVRAGLVVGSAPPPGGSRGGSGAAGPWYRPVPLLAVTMRARGGPPAAERRRRWRAAAAWYQHHDLPGPAARALLAAGEPAACAVVLREHGARITVGGGAALVVELVRALPAGHRDARLRLVHGEALAVVGDNDAALAELTALGGATGSVDAAIAWRQAAVHYQRAEGEAALAALARGRLDTGRTRDEALLLAQTATVRWSTGAADECGELARRALAVAGAADDDAARAAAHVALALHAALVGDRAGNAGHYDKALTYAERGGDAVQVARIRANHVSLLLEEARYPDALAAAGPAVASAEAAGHAALLALTLVNEAEALVRLGRLDDAERRYRRAIAINQRTGSRKVAYPLIGLGVLHAYRGEASLARAAFEEAVRAADADGFLQCLVPALAGLARVVATGDPAAGRAIAARAEQRATGPLRTLALLAVGWAELAVAERAAAYAAADAAAGSARQHRDRAGLAEALQLRAFAGPDRVAAAEQLREAARTWRAAGSVVDGDRVAVWLARLPSATAAERLAGRLARARLEEAGILLPAVPGWPALNTQPRDVPDVAIRTLGSFEVVVAGRPVPASTWQSRKARDLLRMLVARRGRAVPREELGVLLWGDDPPGRVAHRLSVALSTLRSVLDPDRRAPADHYLVAASGGVGLRLANLGVDLETFLSEADLGLRLEARGDAAGAYTALSSAARHYGGDFCEDEPYESWSEPAREEARAAYLRVLRTLARLSAGTGRVDEATGHLLRLLRLDPYDEQCHRDLVELLTRAGRHGEARRASARYEAAMRELGLTPAGSDTRG